MSRPQEINILLLGETGVGKSTFINAFANYIMYEKMTNDKYEEIVIKIGQDECFPSGQSSTQKSRSYSFPYEDKIINLIDTPGIGDSRGIDQDKKNIDNILQFISNYKEMHGICILLKPNNVRLTLMFRFLIIEILTHLHPSVAQNIVFCFTHSRSTFYRPGDTLPALKNILLHNPDVGISLAQDTIYCMDNESFRFLTAKKKGVYFTEEDRQDYSVSWARSANETKRLLAYIQTLKPHTIKDILSLN
jgi:GTPase SAR1 family protein